MHVDSWLYDAKLSLTRTVQLLGTFASTKSKSNRAKAQDELEKTKQKRGEFFATQNQTNFVHLARKTRPSSLLETFFLSKV